MDNLISRAVAERLVDIAEDKWVNGFCRAYDMHYALTYPEWREAEKRSEIQNQHRDLCLCIQRLEALCCPTNMQADRCIVQLNMNAKNMAIISTKCP